MLKLLGKLERRQPAWAKRGLSASRRGFKNQCADKGFRDRWRAARSRTPVRFILPSSVACSPAGNRPSPAHLSDILFSFHFEFSGSPATLQNLRWHRAVPGQGPTTRFGRSMLWLGIKALETEHYCRKHNLSTTSSMRWARHLLSADDLRKRAEHLRNLPPRKRRNGSRRKSR